jgi:glycosyltransferase involved in cell wall biosynthesis
MLKPASALLSMSAYEGSPNVILEAMAAGCPLIVSDIAAHREFLDQDKAIFVPRDDSAALIDAVHCLLTDPLAARKRADLARASVSELTVGRAAELYEEVYLKMRALRAREREN